MQIQLRNVGIIRDATIEPRRFTIIMGPNNSGKSTAATAMYAAIKAAYSFRLRSGIYHRMNRSSRHRQVLSEASLAKLRSTLRSTFRRKRRTVVTNEMLAPFSNEIAAHMLNEYGQAFVEELEAGTGSKLIDLARRSPSGIRRLPLKISVSSQTPAWRVNISLREGRAKVDASISNDFNLGQFEFSAPWLFEDVEMIDNRRTSMFMSMIIDELIGPQLFLEFPKGAHYLPAARAGLLQSHRLVAAALVQRTPLVGLGEMTMPALSGVVADFISEILLSDSPPIETRTRKHGGRIQRIADRIESFVLHGKVQQQLGPDTAYPEIEFEDTHGKYPIHRTSSMVSELAPIVLLLRRSIRENDMLLIEEPESHLHPDTQTKLANILFHASTSLSIFVTTHSDYFLSQINNDLRDQKLKDDSLAEGTSAYEVQKSDLGSKFKELAIDRYEGIQEDLISNVASNLYTRQVQQQTIMSEEGP